MTTGRLAVHSTTSGVAEIGVPVAATSVALAPVRGVARTKTWEVASTFVVRTTTVVVEPCATETSAP